jgi:glycosyltransferase involved in cell wall biosynthesis
LAACLIVKDEAEYIERCLDNINPHVDGVFIYDTGSTDDTVALAEGRGAKVERGEWRKDFAWARNQSYALPPEEYDWIVYFDADDTCVDLERLRPLTEEHKGSYVDAFSFPYHNDWGGLQVDYHTKRLCRRASGYYWKYPLHEQLVLDRKEHVVVLDSPVWTQRHTLADRERKTERNLVVLLERAKDGIDEWLAAGIVFTMIEQGRAREAHGWLVDNGWQIRLEKT